MSNFKTAQEFAQFIKGLGFRAFVAKNTVSWPGHGFITNTDGSRVVSFQMDDGSLGGNYGPPTRESGTGWRMDETIWSLKSAADVQRVLDANPPAWCRRAGEHCPTCGRPHSSASRGDGWQYMTTLEQHLSMYGSSSGYQEV